ncbi:hypothetical protein JOM56_011316 [Amanita muscaria]
MTPKTLDISKHHFRLFLKTRKTRRQIIHHLSSDSKGPGYMADDFGPPGPASVFINVEALTLADLMRNPLVVEMHAQYMDAQKQVVASARTQAKLVEENLKLREKLDTIATDSTRSSSAETTSSSLSLQPATRPSQYPLTVLWNFEDIPNGTKNSRSEWNALRGSGKYMRTQVLSEAYKLDKERDGTIKERRTKTDFMHDYPALWQETVKNLEAQQPLLALCTNHWKADHLLAYIMRSSKKRKDGEEDDDDNDDDNDDDGLKVGNAAQTGGTQINVREKPCQKSSAQPQDSGTQTGGASTSSTSTTNSKRPRTSTASSNTVKPKKKQKACNNQPETQEPSAVKQNIPLSTQAFMNAPINQGMTGSNHIDVSFIVVDPSIESLKMFFRTDYSHIAAGSKLMDAFELNPTFGNNEMSEDVKGFLCRLETADPNDPSIDDDEKGLAWGHCQFTANPVPWRSVFASWGSIGKPANACLVIAAAMRTCSVARHDYQGSEASEASFTADAYLQELTELILEVWISADGPLPAENEPISQPSAKATRRRKPSQPLPPSATTGTDGCPSVPPPSSAARANSSSKPVSTMTTTSERQAQNKSQGAPLSAKALQEPSSPLAEEMTKKMSVLQKTSLRAICDQHNIAYEVHTMKINLISVIVKVLEVDGAIVGSIADAIQNEKNNKKAGHKSKA